MLVRKEPEELWTQKMICYGTIMILLLYLMKFIKFMSKKSYYLEEAGHEAPCNQTICSNVPKKEQTQETTSDERNDRKAKKPRRRRHHRYMPEQWLPKDIRHNYDMEY